jgi:hypothetical protein
MWGIAIGQQTLARARTHIIYIGIVLSEKIIIILKKSCRKIWWIEKYVVSL